MSGAGRVRLLRFVVAFASCAVAGVAACFMSRSELAAYILGVAVTMVWFMPPIFPSMGGER